MTQSIYAAGFALVVNRQLDWVADDIRCLLVSSAYTFNPAHQFVSQVTGELTDGSYARKVLGTKSVDTSTPQLALYKAAAITWTALSGVTAPATLIVYKRVTNDADSVLIAAGTVSNYASGQDFNITFEGVTPGPVMQITLAAGVQGSPGASFLAGAGVPGAGVGIDGDHYVNLTNGDVYGPKTSGAWGSVAGSIRGATGTAGSAWSSGSVVPDDGSGANGDFYFRFTTGDVYQKLGGTWGLLANLNGAAGTPGSAGAAGSSFRSGAGVPSSGLGANGDTYMNVSNGDLYQKSAGAWGSPVGNLTGPAVAPPAINNDNAGSRNAVAADFGRDNRMGSASATAITIPSGLSTIATGETAIFRQVGTGLLSLVQGGGVTLNNLTGKTLNAAGQGAEIGIRKVAADVYDLLGAFA